MTRNQGRFTNDSQIEEKRYICKWLVFARIILLTAFLCVTNFLYMQYLKHKNSL